jgi:Glycosyl transferases group 1
MTTFRREQNILFVFTYNFVADRAGGLNRARQILTLLKENGIAATVYSRDGGGKWFWRNSTKCWRDQDKVEFGREFPDFELVLDRVTFQSWFLRKLKNMLCTMLPAYADTFLRLSVPWLDPNWRALRRRGAAAIVVGYANSLPELNGLFGGYRVIDQIDIEFVLNQRIRQRPFFALPVLAKARREFGMLETAHMILSLSFSERIVNKMILRNPEIIYLPYLSQFDAASYSPREPKYDLLFVGAYSHFNRQGLAKFLREAVHHKTKYRIAVAGTVCKAPEIREIVAGAANVELLGFVNDLGGLYSVSRATVCPVWGAGTKTKILESLQHMRPTFASETSFEGLLPGYENCVFPLNLDSIEWVLESKPDIHLECRRYIESYERAVRQNRFLDKMNSVVARPHPHPESWAMRQRLSRA